MQEEIERRTVAISVTTGKLTGRVLAKALQAFLRKLQKEHQAAQAPHGRQSVKKLMNHGVSTSSIPLDGETRLFDRVARKYNVDYSFHKTGPKKYTLFFKAGQADAITACFSEYTKRMMNRAKDKRPSILAQLKAFGERTRQKPRQQDQRGPRRNEVSLGRGEATERTDFGREAVKGVERSLRRRGEAARDER